MANDRVSFTEDEGERLNGITTEFCKDLAIAAARAMANYPEDIRVAVMYHLQDATSLFSPFTHDLIMDYLNNKVKE
jgi:hypothetical protein